MLLQHTGKRRGKIRTGKRRDKRGKIEKAKDAANPVAFASNSKKKTLQLTSALVLYGAAGRRRARAKLAFLVLPCC